MNQIALRAVFMRGGTSKAVMFRAEDLPPDRAQWAPIFLGVIGSPDANGRQLDGMGGGVSSLSKVCVIGPPTHPGADVDYTFAQVSVTGATVDYSGNCGNMSSAIGPFAVDEGLVKASGPEATVRIHNTNTHKLIVAHFAMDGGRAAVDGDFALPGVAGTGAPVRLDFLAPGGAGTGKLLPTGNVIDRLEVAGVGAIEVSAIDAANPCVFVAAETLGMTGIEMPDELDGNRDLLDRLEAIRIAGSLRMGITCTVEEAQRKPSIPKVAMVTGPRAARTLAGERIEGERCGFDRAHDLDRPTASRSAVDWRNVPGGSVAIARQHRPSDGEDAEFTGSAGQDRTTLGTDRSRSERATHRGRMDRRSGDGISHRTPPDGGDGVP